MTHITDLPDEVLFQIYNYLEVSTLKALQLIPDFSETVKYYLYRNSLYLLRICDDQINSLTNKEKPLGYELSLLDTTTNNNNSNNNNESMKKHISHFRHYQVNLLLIKFDNLLNKLDCYKDTIIQDIFNRDISNGNGNGNSQGQVSIKLLIQLNYSLSTFNQVKDCLVNMDKVSKYFSNNGKNSITIDLELNSHDK